MLLFLRLCDSCATNAQESKRKADEAEAKGKADEAEAKRKADEVCRLVRQRFG